MESVSYIVLTMVALLAFVQLKEGGRGQLTKWVKAKTFNAADPNKKGESFEANLTAFGAVPGGVAGASGLTNPLPGGTVSAQGHFGDCRAGCSRRHQGIDLFLPAGTPIRAAGAGRVTFAGASGSYGLRVDVDHGNGWLTRYAHNATNNVRVGQVVGAGEQVATLGATGNAEGAHLHFETHDKGKPVDPAGVIPGIGGP